MESLYTSILKYRFLMATVALLVLFIGYRSYDNLPIDAVPDVAPTLVQVFTVTEGLAPQEVEKYVTYPIEVSMNGLPHIEKTRSVSNFGLSVVNIYFEDGTDIYFARQIVGEQLQVARKEIPEGFGEPEMGPISTAMGLVLFYYLEDSTEKYSLVELRTMQDWIVKPYLSSIPGVTEVLGIGGYEKQIHLILRPNALLEYGLTVEDIVELVRANNRNVGAQFISVNSEELVVRSVGVANSEEDLANIVLLTQDGTPVTLDQVAEIQEGGAIRRGVQSLNGTTEVVAGMVVKLYGSNTSKVIAHIEERVSDLNKTLPAGVTIVPYYEQKSLVHAAVTTVQDTLLLGILLVAIILVLFLGSLRPSLVVALSIPFSILFAAIGMSVLGLSANLMSLGGLAIAIGMLVDATIVTTL